MLALTRKKGESIVLPSAGITITVKTISKHRVTLGIDAPRTMGIYRLEAIGGQPEQLSSPSALEIAREVRGGACR